MINLLIKWLFPLKCMFCGEISDEGDICRTCVEKAEKLRVLPENRNVKYPCFKNLDGCQVWFFYKDVVRQAVLKAKFHNCHSFIREFAELIPNDFKDFCTDNSIDIIAPVPVHKSKFYTREYTLTYEMVKRIAKMYGLDYNIELVKKVKKTKNQHDLTLDQRKTNLNGAFEINVDVKGKNILIVDDIVTTGYTLENVAKCLKKAGAEKVIAVCFAYNRK